MLSLEECRKKLGYDQDISEEAISILRESLYLMADALFDDTLHKPQELEEEDEKD